MRDHGIPAALPQDGRGVVKPAVSPLVPYGAVIVVACGILLGARTLYLATPDSLGYLPGAYGLFSRIVGLLATIVRCAIGILITAWWRRQLSIEAVRQAAAARAPEIDARLAATQPTAAPQGGVTRMEIKLRPAWSKYPLYLFPFLLMVLFGTVAGWALFPLPGREYLSASWYLNMALILTAELAVVAYPVLFLFAARQRLVVTDQKLALVIGGMERAIWWDEARLFAIRGRGSRSDPPIWYELSSASTTLGFVRARRKMPFPSPQPLIATRPRTSFEEYDREMEALLGLIAAKTGLPLYDLR